MLCSKKEAEGPYQWAQKKCQPKKYKIEGVTHLHQNITLQGMYYGIFFAVLWIQTILHWIRIRILLESDLLSKNFFKVDSKIFTRRSYHIIIEYCQIARFKQKKPSFRKFRNDFWMVLVDGLIFKDPGGRRPVTGFATMIL